MMLSIFFVDQGSDFSAAQIEVTGDEAHHGINVLRLKLAEKVKVSDGVGNWAIGTVCLIGKKSFLINLLEQGQVEVSNPKIIVVQAILKNDANKEAIDFLTQVGVDEIIPWQSQNSIGKYESKSLTKLRAVARESSRQSRRVRIPIVHEVLTTEKLLLKIQNSSDVFVLHEGADQRLSQIEINKKQDLILVIGPEGGINNVEISNFEIAGAKVVRLGESVLRAANAGAAATVVVMSRIGKW